MCDAYLHNVLVYYDGCGGNYNLQVTCISISLKTKLEEKKKRQKSI